MLAQSPTSPPISLLILAAGVGSRYGGLKQLEKIGPNGETLIDYSLADAQSAGFQDIVFVIRKELEELFQKQLVSKWQGRFHSMRYAYQALDSCFPKGAKVPEQRQKPWGTGHAVLCGQTLIHNPFGVINADDYYGKSSLQLLADDLRQMSAIGRRYLLVSFPLGKTLSPCGTVSRGVCMVDRQQMLQKIEEHKALCQKPDGIYSAEVLKKEINLQTPVSMNLWGFTPELFGWLETQWRQFLQGKQRHWEKDEFILPETIHNGIVANHCQVMVKATPDKWLGVTYREDLTWVKQNLPW